MTSPLVGIHPNQRTRVKTESDHASQKRGLSRVFLMRQRIRSNLKLHQITLSAFASLVMPHRVGTVVGPHAPALPAGIRVVDAPIHTAYG